MDFNSVYEILFGNLNEIDSNKEADLAKSVHDNNNIRIKRNCLNSRESERKNYEAKKRVIRDRKERSKLSNIRKTINSLSPL